MNKERNTSNTELQDRIKELERSRDELYNLLFSSNIATLFLDRELHIKLFSPLVTELLNVRTADIGRPIMDFTAKIANEYIVREAQQVLETLIPVERDIWSNGDDSTRRCYLRRISPYRTAAPIIPGVVVTYMEITHRHRQEEELETRVYERTRELAERETRLKAVTDSVLDAIIIIDQGGTIESTNPATEQIFGYQEGELTGQNVRILMPSPYREKHDDYIARYLNTGKPTVLGNRREFIGQRKDGSQFPLELAVTQIDHIDMYVGVVRDLSEKRYLEREVINASVHEQERIGRDIHDNLGQQLTGLNLMAANLKNELSTAGFGESRNLGEIITQLQSLIGESRVLVRGLAPVMIGHRSLIDAIKTLAAHINDNLNIKCAFRYQPDTIEFADSTDATHIYRIAQETANNALKYAEANYIKIDLDVVDESLELSVSDDGRGFDLEARKLSDGFGLRTLQYRADILGGHLNIDTAPGQGTKVLLTIPYVKPS